MGRSLDYAAAPSPIDRRLLTAIHVSAVVYPFLLLAAQYGAWLLGWLILGYRPMYGKWPDPTQLFGYFIHCAVLLLSVSFPLGMMLGLGSVVMLCVTLRAPGRAILWAMILAGLWVAFFRLVWWDPLGVGEWLID